MKLSNAGMIFNELLKAELIEITDDCPLKMESKLKYYTLTGLGIDQAMKIVQEA